MNRGYGLVLTLLLGLFCAGALSAADGAQEKTVREFFTVTNFQDSYQKSVDLILENHIASRPELEQFRPVLKAFFDKFLSWKQVEGKMIRLYSEAFTEEELRELIAFFSTPVGKKWAKVQPDLVLKGAKIEQEVTEEHLPELRQMMNEQIQKLRAGTPGAAAPSPAAPKPAKPAAAQSDEW